MEQLQQLLSMAVHMALVSFFAVGGGVSMLIPQLHREFVLEFHWLTERSFAELLAVAQAAPGPNFLLIPLIGFRIASWPGAAVAILAFLLFPVTIAFTIGRILHHHENVWIVRIRRAFRPVTGGLWIASGLVVAATVDHTLIPIAITAIVTAISLAIDIPPIWWCLIAGVAGYALA